MASRVLVLVACAVFQAKAIQTPALPTVVVPTPMLPAAFADGYHFEPFEGMTDEFNGDGLNTSKWGPTGWLGRQPALFDMANVEVADGELRLHGSHANITDPALKAKGYANYSTALIATKTQTHYGYFETNFSVGNSTLSSSFWFMTQHGPIDGWSIEIDVFEIVGGHSGPKHSGLYPSHTHIWETPLAPVPNASIVMDKCHCKPDNQAHSPCTQGQVENYTHSFSDDYHVAGFLWNETDLVFFLDGNVVYRKPNYCSNTDVSLLFDREAFTWIGPLPEYKDLPDAFRVDYIRAWKLSPANSADTQDPENLKRNQNEYKDEHAH